MNKNARAAAVHSPTLDKNGQNRPKMAKNQICPKMAIISKFCCCWAALARNDCNKASYAKKAWVANGQAKKLPKMVKRCHKSRN